jgi:hypothetical protein
MISSAMASTAGGYAEAERLGGLEVDHEVERCWLHHRKFGGPFAFENSASIDSNLAISISQTGAIADKSSRLGKFAAPMHRGNCVTASHFRPHVDIQSPMGAGVMLLRPTHARSC